MSKIRALIVDDSSVMRVLSCGARGYIRKPLPSDQVKEHVLPVVEKKP